MNVRGLLAVNMLLAAAMAGFAWWVAAGLENGAELPIHWNASGEVDRSAPALFALLFPAGVSMLVGLLLAATPNLEPLQDRLEASAPVMRAVWIGFILLMVYLQLMIAAPAFGWRLGPDLLLVGVGTLFVMVGNSLPKSRPSFFVGIRTPWTLTDTDNWIATHRLGGKLMMVAGGLLVLAAFVPIAPSAKVATIIAAIAATTVIPFTYSWWLWRKKVS